MVYKVYYSSPIDTCLEKSKKQVEEFKEIFENFTKPYCSDSSCKYIDGVSYPIKVYGVGFTSPLVEQEDSDIKKGVVCAYDLRQLRECDVLLVVTDLKQFAAGTMMELEYARNLGIYTIVYVTTDLDENCKSCMRGFGIEREGADSCSFCEYNPVKNIFLGTYVNKIIYNKEELIEILEELTK